MNDEIRNEREEFKTNFSLKELVAYRNILAMTWRMIYSDNAQKNERHWKLVNEELEDRFSLTGDFLWNKNSHLRINEEGKILTS